MQGPLSRRVAWIQRLGNQIVATLSDRVRMGELSSGDALGTRQALADEFVTTSQVMDHAIDELIREGVVEEKEGGQVVVVGYPEPEQGFTLPRSDAATRDDIIQILELRIGVETVAASLAATRASKPELAAIREAARAYEAAASEGSGVSQADFRFHRAIAAASGNAYILDLIDAFGPILIPRLRLAPPEPTGSDGQQNLRQSQAEHEEILASIKARDPDTAQAAMRSHLNRALALMNAADAK